MNFDDSQRNNSNNNQNDESEYKYTYINSNLTRARTFPQNNIAGHPPREEHAKDNKQYEQQYRTNDTVNQIFDRTPEHPLPQSQHPNLEVSQYSVESNRTSLLPKKYPIASLSTPDDRFRKK